MDKIKQFEPLFGDWYAESLIGAGSFGRVYKIYRDELDNRFYSALKHISIPSDGSEVNQLRMDGMDDRSISTYYTELTKSITEETKLMNRLRGNTNIVSFEDSKVIPKENGVGYDIFIRMELLTSLPSRLVKAPLTKQEAVQLGADICNALTICSQYGIIHRDIKPDNIFISDTGAFKLGDFGVARQLENTSAFMSKKGTYNYMAPEVYRGEKYGPQCDIYSLGLVMYRLLNNGRLPFLPPAPQAISPNDRETSLVRRMNGEAIPAPCGADEALSAIVLKACAFDPAQRYKSAAEMRADLENYTSGKPVRAAAEPSAAAGVFDLADDTETVAIPHEFPIPPASKPPVQPKAQQPAPKPPVQPKAQQPAPKPPVQPKAQQPAPKPPVQSQAQQPAPKPPVQPKVQQPETGTPAPKKSKKGLIIGIIAGAAALLLIIGLVLGLSGGSSSPEGTYKLKTIDGKNVKAYFSEMAEQSNESFSDLLGYLNISESDLDSLMTITINSNGTGRMNTISSDPVDFNWELKDDQLILTYNFSDIVETCEFKNGAITMQNDGVTLVFRK